MPRWTSTRWVRYHFGTRHEQDSSKSKKWSDGAWNTYDWYTDHATLDQQLNELTAWCNENQFVIKTVLPLTWARAYDYGQTHWHSQHFNNQGVSTFGGWGLGQGWGVGMIVGFTALLEKTEDVTDAEFARRADEPRRAREIEKLKGQIAQLDGKTADEKARLTATTNSVTTATSYAAATIETKKQMLGTRYFVLDKDFKTHDEAQKFINRNNGIAADSSAAIPAIQAAIDSLLSQRRALEQQIAQLES